ncbi:unnamed protein product (macronuclear) [Paramecium tetraurelia]|uniref:Uncharacterized protein n=1 Tax=Paramecium tetraurelia TaxID=5888 RepID=A0C2K1_PARTE|nr:uncharacterized protein GSPATT00034496001 [Paramecium tetraurelia]CAK65018.1 unnamed protein product [Paramecium tetraurelia]|eukprot:XP_001432415.1 hypothetical protein (macronuclear) [Paramecium tetraurelia strain d4-2]
MKEDDNPEMIENNFSELSIDENAKQLNKFISNYQSLISYNITQEKYICHLSQKKIEHSKDNKLLSFCKEVFAKMKDINEKFDQLNISVNLFQETNLDKIKNKNDSLLKLFSQAKDSYSKEKKTEAFQKFTEVLTMNPNFIDARIYRGIIKIMIQKGYLSLDVNNTCYAQFDFEEVLKQDKYNLKALKGITKAFKMQCNYELGLKYALKVIKYEPKSPIGNFNAGI